MASPTGSSDASGPTGFLARPLGLAGVLVLEAYFVSLGTVTAYVLWRIWPKGDALAATALAGGSLPLSADPDSRLILSMSACSTYDTRFRNRL